MVPIRDTLRCTHPPVMTWALIVVNTATFLIGSTLPVRTLNHIYYTYGLVPARFSGIGFPPGVEPSWFDYWPFVTNMFLHAGALHLVLNMWMLWIFGDNIEDRMGSWRFLAFYLICGVVAAYLHWITNASSFIPAVGASGAIAGILGAYFILYPHARLVLWVPIFFLPIFFEVPAIAFLGVWVLIQLYRGTSALSGKEAAVAVAWWGHLGGFAGGVLLYRLFLRKENASAGD